MLYDTIIIGGGPAGLAAAIYGQRYGLKTLILTKDLGGDAAKAFKIENYPGFESIAGQDFVDKIVQQTKKSGAQIILETVTDVKKLNNNFEVATENSSKYQSKTLILAFGLKRRHLKVPGEGKFLGKGISFCFTCDGPLFKNKIVMVVGGGNAGVSSAIFLADIAQKVYLVEMERKLTADAFWLAKLKRKKNVKIILGDAIKEIKGDKVIRSIILKKNGEIKVDGIFVEIGSVPDPVLPQKLGIKLDQNNFIKVSADQSTNIKGIWAAGDVTTASNFFWQTTTAVAEGAIAAYSISKYL